MRVSIVGLVQGMKEGVFIEKPAHGTKNLHALKTGYGHCCRQFSKRIWHVCAARGMYTMESLSPFTRIHTLL